MKKLDKYWKKTAALRQSLPNLLRPQNVFKNEESRDSVENLEEKSMVTQFNESLMSYKEMKWVYKKTGIHPVYFIYGLALCLFLILIGYLENYLTYLIGTTYPLYISIKTLKNEESTKDDIKQWLTYW
jgi:hypothetical protein